MTGFPKGNTHIKFIEDVHELTGNGPISETAAVEPKMEAKITGVPEIEEIVQLTQAKKKAYKKLQEQISKGKNYDKILNALIMQKHLMVLFRLSDV